MTGQGNAQSESDVGTICVEIRSVNHRGLKCVVRTSEALAAREGLVESLVRSRLHRGSVQINVTWRRPGGETPQRLDVDVLGSYYRQCLQARENQDGTDPIDISNLVNLPGVLINDHGAVSESQEELDAQVRSTVGAALENFNRMREAEGANMVASLVQDCEGIDGHLRLISEISPQVVENYRERLENKVRLSLQRHDVSVDAVDLLREVQIYADKADISEEITRLNSHLKLFVQVIQGKHVEKKDTPEPTGRRLDFIVQEMFRETNTIGSKANHSGISAEVVEIKCTIERMRELVQNLE